MNRIEINFITYIFLLIAFLSGRFEYMFLLIFIITVHELGHLVTASIFNIKASTIKIYLFGGVTEYETDQNIPIYKELIILIAGPLSQILLILIIYNLKSYINIETYMKFIEINKILLIFNLLPIINLDGGKLLNLLFNKIFSYKFSFKLSIIISILALPLLVIIPNKLISLILIIFLIKNIIKEIKMHKHNFNKLLLERYLTHYEYYKVKIIKDINDFKKDKKHIILHNGKFLKEKEFLKEYFNKNKFS